MAFPRGWSLFCLVSGRGRGGPCELLRGIAGKENLQGRVGAGHRISVNLASLGSLRWTWPTERKAVLCRRGWRPRRGLEWWVLEMRRRE